MEMTLESLELIEELAYTAGIVDGEGCIRIGRTRNGFRLLVDVANTDEWLVLWLQAHYGGNIYGLSTKTLESRKQCYHWYLCGWDAIDFLESILPYLHLKKPQAEVAIEFQKRRSLTHQCYTKSELALQEADYILMASFNKRGVK